VLMHAPRQGCSGVVSADRLVGWGLGHIDRARRGTENVFSTHPPPDLTAVAVPGDRQSDLETGRYVTFPPVIHKRIPLTLEETIADIGRVAADIQLRTPDTAAVRYIVQKRPFAAPHVDGLCNCKIHRVLDHAARVARRQFDVRDNLIQGIFRIHLAVRNPDELFVLPDIAERGAPEGRRCTRLYYDPGY